MPGLCVQCLFPLPSGSGLSLLFLPVGLLADLPSGPLAGPAIRERPAAFDALLDRETNRGVVRARRLSVFRRNREKRRGSVPTAPPDKSSASAANPGEGAKRDNEAVIGGAARRAYEHGAGRCGGCFSLKWGVIPRMRLCRAANRVRRQDTDPFPAIVPADALPAPEKIRPALFPYYGNRAIIAFNIPSNSLMNHPARSGGASCKRCIIYASKFCKEFI